MPKSKSIFQCQFCGYVSPKWLGRCPDCGQWNGFIEERKVAVTNKSSRAVHTGKAKPQPLNSIVSQYEQRISTGIKELDRVLGGGIISGSVILIGGDPGIGKSTLLLQTMYGISKRYGKVLYVSGEESPEQIKIRSERLSINSEDIILISETSLEAIIHNASQLTPKGLVVDSIQTVYTEELVSAPGSVSQVRDCASKLMLFAKRSGIPIFIVGHVTKEGAIAGPRVLEHIVDTVLYFEGDKGYAYRILRTVKNRFGATNEIGVFEMSDAGLIEVKNPSQLFLLERPFNVSGSTVVVSLEGSRPLMIEIQSLVSQSTFGMPRRTAMGIDFNRLNLLVAVLEKRVGFHLSGMDIFVNVVGGLRIMEPAIDLGIVTAIASSLRNIPVAPHFFMFGEVGLSGEVRAVTQAEARLKEASTMGFKKALIPLGNVEKIRNKLEIEIIGVKTIEECFKAIFD